MGGTLLRGNCLGKGNFAEGGGCPSCVVCITARHSSNYILMCSY